LGSRGAEEEVKGEAALRVTGQHPPQLAQQPDLALRRVCSFPPNPVQVSGRQRLRHGRQAAGDAGGLWVLSVDASCGCRLWVRIVGAGTCRRATSAASLPSASARTPVSASYSLRYSSWRLACSRRRVCVLVWWGSMTGGGAGSPGRDSNSAPAPTAHLELRHLVPGRRCIRICSCQALGQQVHLLGLQWRAHRAQDLAHPPGSHRATARQPAPWPAHQAATTPPHQAASQSATSSSHQS